MRAFARWISPEPLAAKVPQIGLLFWVVKLLTTAGGEAASDLLSHDIAIGGSMGRVIKNTSQLSPEDRAAIAAYLKSLPPVDGPPRPKKAAKSGDKS